MATDIATLPIPLDIRRHALLQLEAARRAKEQPVHAEAMQQAVLWLACQGVQTSVKAFEKKYYEWRRTGEALAFLDKRRIYGRNHEGAAMRNLAFVHYWVQLVADYQRSAAAAYQELCKRWAKGEVIPGYEKCWDRRFLPKGWSYDNLCRMLPGKKALDIYRKGVVQAHGELAQVLSTRVGSYPLQFVFFDDVWVDRLSRFGVEINRCMQLGALDFCTGKRLVYGTKFRHRRPDGSHVYFDGDDMLLEICDLLLNVGYNAQKGTTLVVENGTACISKEVEEMLAALSGGKIRVDRSGKVGMRQLLRGYGGQAKGNPDHKAPIESWHNLFHNRLCHGPGWAGKDRTPPETVYGVIQAEKQHIRNLADLPPDRALLSRGHLPTFSELCEEIIQVVEGINQREDHALEGWEGCGFVRHEFCLDLQNPQWTDTERALAAAPGMQQVVAQLPRRHMRVRRLSPNEAWAAATALPDNKPTRFTPEQGAMLLSLCKGLHIKQKAVFTKGHFVWKDKTGWLDYAELHYEAVYVDAMGYDRPAPYKDGLTGVMNPFDPARLFLFDNRGVLLGWCRKQNVVKRSDLEAVKEALGRKRHIAALQLEYMQDVLSPVEQEILAKKEWNKHVADYNKEAGEGAPLTLPEACNAAAQKVAREKISRRAAVSLAARPALPQAAEGAAGLGLPEGYDEPGTFLP